MENYNVYGHKSKKAGITADDLRVKKTPTNYDQVGDNLASHLNGIDDKIGELIGNGVSDLQQDMYVGVAYNKTDDLFVRLGRAQGIDVGLFPGTWISPIFERLRRVVLADDGSVYKSVSWLDFTKHDDGTDVDRTGANGQIMVEYLPGYYKASVIGDWQVILLSHLPLSGFTLFPAFDGMSAVYLGAYEASVYDDKLCSIAVDPADGTSPVFPVTTRGGSWGHAGLTTQVTDQLAEARGAGWQQADLMTRVWERLLQIVGFASFNIPGIVGDGRINITVGDWVNGERIGKCGLGDASAGYASAVQNGGTSGYLTDYSQVLGVENTYGNIWDRVTSLVSDGDVYYKSTPPYDYSSVSGWTRLLDASGAGITLPQASGWAGTPHSGLGMVLPSDVTGSSSTKMHDYYYNNSCSCLRVLLVGGFAYNVSDAGSFYWSAADVASSTYAGIGGRLGFKKAI